MRLACKPRLLIADELTEKMGTAVFLITHDLALAAERADRIGVMFRGEIVEEGDSAQLLANPQHEYTKQLLAAAPSLASSRDRRPVASAGEVGTDAAAPLVEVVGLRKEFTLRSPKPGEPTTFTAVDGVSFSIPRGQTVSIVGESGSGKSTIANLVLGLDDITAGTIAFDGTDLAGLSRKEVFAFRRRV